MSCAVGLKKWKAEYTSKLVSEIATTEDEAFALCYVVGFGFLWLGLLVVSVAWVRLI